jgi:aminoglycoside phosphotransferase (APT) family kinase protein
MTNSTTAILSDLLWAAGLPAAESAEHLTGRGFDNEVLSARLADGRRVVLRRRRERGRPEQVRAKLLEAHGMPAPRLLAGTDEASLYEFVPGALLGDLIEAGRATPEVWERVGRAFRRVHAVAFPRCLAGAVGPDQIVLRPCDPVADLHICLEESVPGLAQRAPAALDHIPALHELVEGAAGPLRAAPTALLHGDTSMWNIIVGEDGAMLVDWDAPLVADPARELALLDAHAALFNGQGLDPAFFRGYGRPAAEPNTSLQHAVQTLAWVADDGWETGAAYQPPEQRARSQRWLDTLVARLDQLPAQIERLRALV